MYQLAPTAPYICHAAGSLRRTHHEELRAFLTQQQEPTYVISVYVRPVSRGIRVYVAVRKRPIITHLQEFNFLKI